MRTTRQVSISFEEKVPDERNITVPHKTLQTCTRYRHFKSWKSFYSLKIEAIVFLNKISVNGSIYYTTSGAEKLN